MGWFTGEPCHQRGKSHIWGGWHMNLLTGHFYRKCENCPEKQNSKNPPSM